MPRKLQEINIRTFLREYKNILPPKRPFTITIKNERVATVYPVDKAKRDQSTRITEKDLKSFEKYLIKGGPPDLSENIDKYAYDSR